VVVAAADIHAMLRVACDSAVLDYQAVRCAIVVEPIPVVRKLEAIKYIVGRTGGKARTCEPVHLVAVPLQGHA
jgi:hypothetical protein